MPVIKQLTVLVEDRPGALARICRALADQKVNILALQSSPSEGGGLLRFIVDNVATAKRALDNEGVSYQETDVAQVRLPHRPGELARIAARLAEVEININYAYCGVDPSTSTPLVIFGATDAAEVAMILDRVAHAA
jgi:hypothetical protein